jgi:hypothetical protein
MLSRVVGWLLHRAPCMLLLRRCVTVRMLSREQTCVFTDNFQCMLVAQDNKTMPFE